MSRDKTFMVRSMDPVKIPPLVRHEAVERNPATSKTFKEKHMKVIILVVTALATGNAVADSACDTPKNDFDGLYCLSKIYQEADKELNDNYRQLSKMLDAQGRVTLKHGQTEWMQKRNAECSEYDAKGFLVNMRCATDTTIERGKYVQDRLRECKSSGCLNSKL